MAVQVRAALKNRQSEHKQKWFKTMLAKIVDLSAHLEFGPNLKYLQQCLAFTPEANRENGELWEPAEAASHPNTPALESFLNEAMSSGAEEEEEGEAEPDVDVDLDSSGITGLGADGTGRQLSAQEVKQILLSVEVSGVGSRALKCRSTCGMFTTLTFGLCLL